jgi:catechol 2,3-dioxygenase-like lactoylglutathione lyase family enzyme
MKYTHTRLLVEDFAECFRFYRDVLGFEVGFGEETTGYADFNTGECTIALFDRKEMAAAVGYSHKPVSADSMDRVALIFGVESVDETVQMLKNKGVTLVTEPVDMTDWGIRVALFRDPDGNLLEINQPLAR